MMLDGPDLVVVVDPTAVVVVVAAVAVEEVVVGDSSHSPDWQQAPQYASPVPQY
jgi:hypothetical protein